MKAVILLNMGGPSHQNEVKVFLKNMFQDPAILGIKNKFIRNFLANLIANLREKEAIENYKQIGGKSPIKEITQNLIKNLNSYTRNKNLDIKFDFAMNYTSPFINEILLKYQDCDEILLFPLYPHQSITTSISSLKYSKKVAQNLKIENKIKTMNPFFDDDGYNEICLNLIKQKLKNQNSKDLSLIFSAHSLPQKIIKNGDLYETHIKKHFEILKEKLAKNKIFFKEIILSYQSKLGPVKWLEPNTSDILNDIENKKILIFPIAFCIDNSETDFELNLLYRQIAKKRNFDFYEICRCPNDSDDFVKFIFEKSIKI